MSTTARLRLSEWWRLDERGPLRLTRIFDELELSFGLKDARRARPVLLGLRGTGSTLSALLQGSAPPARRAAVELIGALEAHGAVRRLRPGEVAVSGEGPARAWLEAASRRGGFGRLRVRAASSWRRAQPRPFEVLVLGRGPALFALGSRASFCPHCLLLRVLAREGAFGVDQTASQDVLPKLPASLGRALAAAMLDELGRAPLAAEEVLVARAGAPLARALSLAHPDCPRCGRRPATSTRAAAKDIAARLASRTPLPERGGRALYVDPLLGPVDIEEVQGKRGVYPLDQPFVWGSVHLSRSLNGKVRALSTQGGIYASRADAAEARLVAISEGVERLGARGARPDVWTAASKEPLAVPLSRIYGFAQPKDENVRRGFCHALDLTTGKGALVPFESVAVGLTPDLYPQALHLEPFYSGAASHVTMADAVLNATVEILKRDAFMISWYRRRAVPRLTWPKRPSPLARQRLAYLERAGVRLELFDLLLDFPLPTLLLRMTATRAKGSWPKGGAMLVPSGGFTPMHALEDGLRLAASQWVSIALHPAPIKNPLDPVAVRQMSRRAAFWPLMSRYLDPERVGAFDFLDRGPGPLPFEDLEGKEPRGPAAKLALLRRWFIERKLQWLVVRLTDKNAERAGFEVVKVVVPGLVAIAASRKSTNLRVPRMAYPWPHCTTSTLNPDPHPLY